MLKSVLRERKRRCISKYFAHLNKEENRILNKYAALVTKHFQRYPEVGYVTHFVEVGDENIEM